jgi:hypothetical protein
MAVAFVPFINAGKSSTKIPKSHVLLAKKSSANPINFRISPEMIFFIFVNEK